MTSARIDCGRPRYTTVSEQLGWTPQGRYGRARTAAVVVFPGGGFHGLAINLEGAEPCRWLTSIGVTCVLVKYRVPSAPYRWQCKCYLDHAPAESVPAMEDAERAVRLVRFHAVQWYNYARGRPWVWPEADEFADYALAEAR